jgi:hypothetical protein
VPFGEREGRGRRRIAQRVSAPQKSKSENEQLGPFFVVHSLPSGF